MSTDTPTPSDPPAAEGPLWGCAKHARIGRTCCQGTEILVTEGDRVRIRAHLAAADPDRSSASRPAVSTAARDDFWVDDWPRDSAYCDDGSDPGWTLAFHVDGSRPILKHGAGHDCTFLGARGCTLPEEVRPIVCRLHPYAYDEHGILPTPPACPPEVVPEGTSILELLDMRLDRAEEWRAQLYAEIRANPGRGRA